MKICNMLLVAVMVMGIIACEKKKPTLINPLPLDYKQWARPVPPLTYPVPGHGDSKRVIFINQEGLRAKIKTDIDGVNRVIYPWGTIIVKEVFQRKGRGFSEKPQLTIMVKDPATKETKSRSGWLYYVKNSNENTPSAITNKMCEGCHDAANERHLYFDKNMSGMFRDYVFLNPAR